MPLGFSFPAQLPLALFDEQVVDAGKAEFHVAKFIELPVLVAVSAIPLAGVVVIFILETDRDAIADESKECFLQAIIEFAIPFVAEEFDDLRPAMQELGAVAPFGVLRVGECDVFGIAGVPSVLGSLDFLTSGFFGKRRERRAWVHASFDS